MKILVLLGVTFVCSMQPLITIVSMIMITLVYSIYLYMFMGTYWFSYMLLMIVLSGVLVIFTYVISLMSNEVFEMLGIMYLCMWIYVLMMMKVNYLGIQMEDWSLMMLKMWESFMGVYNFFIVMFLLFMMLVVVWLSGLEDGALRNI